MTDARRRGWAILVALLGLVVVVAALLVLATPFLVVFGTIAVLGVVEAALARDERVRLAWLLLTGTMSGLVLAEAIGVVTNSEIQPWTSRFQPDRDLGYQLAFDDNERRKRRGGFRATPASEPSSRCRVVFFGGSFAWGQNLEDTETLPQAFAEDADSPVAVYNFGFAGYGPHQMLRMLETGLVEDVVGRAANHAIYVGIPHHIRRAAGRTRWDLDGPRYALRSDGGVAYEGPFRNRTLGWLLRHAQRSYTGSFLFGRGLFSRDPEPTDVSLFVGIVGRAGSLVAESFGGTFQVVLWDSHLYPGLADLLRGGGLVVHDVGEIVPDLLTNPERYYQSDGHPTARANALVGRYLARRLAEERGDGRICGMDEAS